MDKETQDYIINILRRGTLHWRGRSECLNRGRYQVEYGAYNSGKPKFIWARDCDGCGERHLQKNNDLEVDHIDEVGPFNGNIDDYARRMYCGQDNLQALCFTCHARKTSSFNSTLKYARKNKDAIDSL